MFWPTVQPIFRLTFIDTVFSSSRSQVFRYKSSPNPHDISSICHTITQTYEWSPLSLRLLAFSYYFIKPIESKKKKPVFFQSNTTRSTYSLDIEAMRFQWVIVAMVPVVAIAVPVAPVPGPVPDVSDNSRDASVDIETQKRTEHRASSYLRRAKRAVAVGDVEERNFLDDVEEGVEDTAMFATCVAAGCGEQMFGEIVGWK